MRLPKVFGVVLAAVVAAVIVVSGSHSTLVALGPYESCLRTASLFICPEPPSSVTDRPQPSVAPVQLTIPDASNTGVPTGTVLKPHEDSCQLTEAGTVIDGEVFNCDVVVFAPNVLIKNSKVNGIVYLDTDRPESGLWSMTLVNSEVDAGQQQRAAVCCGNMVISGANLHGGVTSAQCEERSVHCTIENSWLHGQYIRPNSNWHLGAFLSDGGGPITLHHNRVVCDQVAVYGSDGGCTGDINLIPNFGTAHDVTITNNLLGANAHSAYCTYGGDRRDGLFPNGNHIVYKDNIFETGTTGKCAAYGAVTGFNSKGVGNVWNGNVWQDGRPVAPEG